MLKLPKGLKKKKKDKKSKKNQELFTEEELEQFKLRARQEAAEEEARKEAEASAGSSGSRPIAADDEWSKFNQLTTGIDSILKKTQGDLDRIKESSFFQRVVPKKPPPPVDSKPAEVEEEKEPEPELTEEEKAEQRRLALLKEAVVELSESEEESEEADDIFDTDYIDTLASGNVPLAYVPDSPEEEADLGPDPFDTAYADKLIKGPEVSKRGKKIVNIGPAVEVLTGKVEKVTATAKRPRRGPQNLLLESFDKGEAEPADEEGDAVVVPPEPQRPVLSLLDDPDDLIGDVPIDLSGSLHLQYLKQKEEEDEKKRIEVARQRELERDEFDELAVESLTKKDEVIVLAALEAVTLAPAIETATKWSEFEYEPKAIVELEDDDFGEENDDPFNTDYAASLVPEVDDDFDPRAEERRVSVPAVRPPVEAQKLTVKPKDLLSGSTSDLTDLSHVPVIAASESIDKEIDPFDTSAVSAIVLPKATEIKFLEKELLSDGGLKHSLSDPDFDPRGDEEPVKPAAASLAERKSSLCLNVGSAAPKTVGFAVNDNLLGSADTKPHKPLTPYYADKPVVDEPTDLLAVDESHDTKVLTPAAGGSNQTFADSFDSADPFDTSNVSSAIQPGRTELKLLENELIEPKHAPTTAVLDINSDSQELGLGGKVLTPQISLPTQESIDNVDPFDTSFASNLAPGQAEIKVLESELIHQ